MGRKRKNKKQQRTSSGAPRQKRQKQSSGSHKQTKDWVEKKYWVQECHRLIEASPFASNDDCSKTSITLVVSRVQLSDDYRQKPIETSNSSNEVYSKADTVVHSNAATLQEDSQNAQDSQLASKDSANEPEGKVSNDTEPTSPFDILEKNKPRKYSTLAEESDSILEKEEEKVDAEDRDSRTPTPGTGETPSLRLIADNQQDCNTKNDSESNKLGTPASSDLVLEKKEPVKLAQVFLVMDESCEGPLTRQPGGFSDLPGGNCGDSILNPFSPKVVPHKYWAQRRRMFSRFDSGIQLDRESWFSVTPEAISNHICTRIVGNGDELVLMDSFGGVGGNTIAFARSKQVKLVVCVDTNRARLEMAASNCRIYDIPPDKVIFIHGDACQVMGRYQKGKLVIPYYGNTSNPRGEAPATVDKEPKRLLGYCIGGLGLLPQKLNGIFLSPPWGGINYERVGPSDYDLNCVSLQPHSLTGVDLIRLASGALDEMTGCLALFFPRNTNGISVAQQSHEADESLRHFELEQQYLCSKLKTVTLYAKACAKKLGEKEETTETDSDRDC